MNKNEPKKISQQTFIRGIKASINDSSNISYGFILGAGASKESGIDTADELTQKWYEEIKKDNPKDELETWEKSLPEFNKNDLAQSYSDIFEKRFVGNPDEGIELLQHFMDKAKPSVGYSFLAQFLEKPNNKFVITTNFDTMTEDALFQYSNSKPLVLGHESLSHFIKPENMTRPTIIKIHRDYLLQPLNTKKELEELDKKWQNKLKPILRKNNMIVIGYGGHDDSLMEYLSKIDTKDRKAIYWCYRDENKISEKIKKLLTKNDYLVKISGFDEIMLFIAKELDFALPVDINNIEKSNMVIDSIKRAEEYALQLSSLGAFNLTKEKEESFKKHSSLDSSMYKTSKKTQTLERVAKYMKTHRDTYFETKGKDIAESLSIDPSTLSRALKIFKQENIYDKSRKFIDYKKLENYKFTVS